MTYRWHLLGGLIAYALGVLSPSSLSLNIATSSFFSTLPLLAICLFGSLLPDIDTTSKIRKIVYGKWLLIFFVLLILILVLVQASLTILIGIFVLSLLPFFVRHRGLFHNIFFLALVPATLAFILSWYFPNQSASIKTGAYFFFLGTLSHVALDKL